MKTNNMDFLLHKVILNYGSAKEGTVYLDFKFADEKNTTALFKKLGERNIFSKKWVVVIILVIWKRSFAVCVAHVVACKTLVPGTRYCTQ